MAHIMAVDDSIWLRYLLVRTLLEGGHKVLEAKDGVEALGLAEREKVQLVITDVNMPLMDGLTPRSAKFWTSPPHGRLAP